MTLCDRDDLVRRLCRILDVAQRTLVRLAGNGYSDPGSPGDNVRPEKVISETAVLAYAAHRLTDIPSVADRVQRLIDLLVPYARSDAVRASIAFSPSLALDFAQAHACLHRMGIQDVRAESILRVAVNAQAARGRERPPHRTMEQAWIAELADVDNEALTAEARLAAAASSLAHPPDLLSGAREDGYAFTHALMYATDFGRRQAKLPRSRSQIVADAEALLIGSIDDEDYDLAGELLLTWPYTGTRWSPAASFAFSVLAQVEDEAGFLPSAGTRLQQVDALAGNQRTDYVLSSAYHTVYVMGLLTAATLAVGRYPRASVTPCGTTVGACSADAAGAPLPMIHERHWQSLMRRARDNKVKLRSFIMIASLRRAARGRDLATVHLLLQRAVDLNVANSAMCSQAMELLLRAQTFDLAASTKVEAFGVHGSAGASRPSRSVSSAMLGG